MQPIVPKGYDINQFPPALSPAQIAIVDEIKAGSSKSDTIGRYQTLVRSEEHTSELQSQFRISYAVFCLKKKKKKKKKKKLNKS